MQTNNKIVHSEAMHGQILSYMAGLLQTKYDIYGLKLVTFCHYIQFPYQCKAIILYYAGIISISKP